MSFLWIAVILLCLQSAVPAQEYTNALDPRFAAWGRVLAKCAAPEGFDYALLLQDDTDLRLTLAQLGSVQRAEFDKFPKLRQLAFLVNAHNAYAVDRVLRHYPVKSIEKTALIGSALNKRRIFLLGRIWSLRELRDEIMGERFRDSRALFVLNWAMKGCAPLPLAPATEDNLEFLLESQTRHFMNDAKSARYDQYKGRLFVSPLLKEYEEDFNRDFTTLWGLMRHFSAPEVGMALAKNPPIIKPLPFDKSLNDSRGAPPAK